ncbi:hypothetical protein ACFYXM_26130 [Streptomyces sp. NPDC002476]
MALTVTPTGDVFTRTGRWAEGRCADERRPRRTSNAPTASAWGP